MLRNELQGNQSLPKWDSRSRLGLYLGQSPRHSRSVSLVLNLQTGLVSPQYHVRHDNLFETLKEQAVVTSEWQQKCHFGKAPKSQKSWFHKIGQLLPSPVRRSGNRGSTGEEQDISAIPPAGEQVEECLKLRKLQK